MAELSAEGRPAELDLIRQLAQLQNEGPIVSPSPLAPPAAVRGQQIGTVEAVNGSGKTTLLKLILGLYRPQDGRVLLDDADIAQFSHRDLTRWIGYVPQEIRLFSGTIRENIAVRSPDCGDGEILEAAGLASVHEFIAALPDGYGTLVGEGGTALPGGIRQKIGIARTFVDMPPVLVLDEPTSNLDTDSENTLAETLRRLSADRTIIVATHSRALLAQCHSLVVLDKGKVVRGGEVRQVMPELFAGQTPRAASGVGE